MVTPEFGKLVWGGRGHDAEVRARIGSIDPHTLIAKGITREMIESWRDGYRAEVGRNPGNPSAAGRADLLDHLLTIWPVV